MEVFFPPGRWGPARLTLNPSNEWYSWVGSNHRPPDPQSCNNSVLSVCFHILARKRCARYVPGWIGYGQGWLSKPSLFSEKLLRESGLANHGSQCIRVNFGIHGMRRDIHITHFAIDYGFVATMASRAVPDFLESNRPVRLPPRLPDRETGPSQPRAEWLARKSLHVNQPASHTRLRRHPCPESSRPRNHSPNCLRPRRALGSCPGRHPPHDQRRNRPMRQTRQTYPLPAELIPPAVASLRSTFGHRRDLRSLILNSQSPKAMNYTRPHHSLVLEQRVIRVLVIFRGASLKTILARVGAFDHSSQVMVGMILRKFLDAGHVRRYFKGFLLQTVPPDPWRHPPPRHPSDPEADRVSHPALTTDATPIQRASR